MKIYGAVEAGGTKFVCGVGTGPEDLRVTRFATTTPEEAVARARAFFEPERICALGVGSFGPVDVDPASASYGSILNTPKAGWQGANVPRELGAALGVPVAVDTDVDAAAVGEARWGAARGTQSCVYLTVGTGIGGGAILGGATLRGRSHPEMGHIRVPHDLVADPFAGVCPYHGDCLEGLASGPAMEMRWGAPGNALPEGHPAWALEAHYLALGVANIALTIMPARVILGGGVMHRAGLFPLIRAELAGILNGYVPVPELVAPELGDRSGVLGALALALGLG